MPFVPFASAVEAELVYSWDGQICENTLYFDLGVIPGVPEMYDLADMLYDWWNTSLKPLQVSTVSLTRILVTSLNTATSPGIERTTGLPAVGTNAGVPLPNNVTGAVTFITGLRGRSYRGRNYVLGLSADMLSLNTILPTPINQYQNAYDDLLAAATTAGFPWVVASRQTAGAWRANGVITPVTAIRMENTVDSQRRRLPGRGQ
jgi:hypothetical protein